MDKVYAALKALQAAVANASKDEKLSREDWHKLVMFGKSLERLAKNIV